MTAEVIMRLEGFSVNEAH